MVGQAADLHRRGFAWFDVAMYGRAAHGSRPELGVDVIANAGRFLTASRSGTGAWAQTPRMGDSGPGRCMLR